jgi:CheY-like chemotaxis protein
MSTQRTILVVEDNAVIRDIIQEMLEEEGFITLGADSTKSAIETLAVANDIDAVFADIDLGDRGGGYEVARQARGRRPNVEIIYTSGGAREDFARERVEHASFVQKPYLPSQVCSLFKAKLAS